MLKNKALITPLGLVSITILSGAFLMSSITSATDNTDVVDEINITVPVSCSLSGTGMTSHNANIVNGTYQADIGSTTLKAFCNDTNGFAIYAIGYTDNEYGKTVLTNSTLGSTYDIATGTATSGNTSNWAMKLATDGTATYAITLDNSFNAYHNVPATYTKVAHRDSGTDIGTGATGAELTSTYAAFMSQTQPAGTYTGQVKYTLVHPSDADPPLSPQPSTPGYITYYANASGVVGTMANQSANDNTTIELYPSNFSRAGYGFAGWSDKYDYASNPSANFYGPNEDFTTPSDFTTKGLSFYAVWVKSEGSLQDANEVTSLCGTNGVGGSLTKAPTDGTADLSSVTALTDQRDNQTYAIAKLADGNCWIIENMRLNNQYTTGETNKDLAQGYNSNFIGLANPETSNFAESTAANSLYSIDGSTENTISGSNQAYRFPRYNNQNTTSRDADTTTSQNVYSYGNYYTWAAAIADTTYYVSGDHDTTSICPVGWKIPQGYNAPSGFAKLDIDMGGTGGDQATRIASNRWRKYPNNFLYSGSFSDSSTNERGSKGSYWSSTAGGYNSETSYSLLLYRTRVRSNAGNSYKYSGSSIRCMHGS